MVVLVALGLVLGRPVGARRSVVRIMGATSLLPFLSHAATRYMQARPGFRVTVTGGGSLAGLWQVSHGRVDVGASDMPASVLGRAAAGQLQGQVLGRLPVLVVVNPTVGLSHLSLRDLRGLLTGRITRWKELGGASENVVVVIRPPGSGARYVVEQTLMGHQGFSSAAVVQLSNGAVYRTVASTPGALGFLDAGFARPGVTVLSLGGLSYDPRQPEQWPWAAWARLYWRKPGSAAVTGFVRWAAAQKDLARYGILGEDPPHVSPPEKSSN